MAIIVADSLPAAAGSSRSSVAAARSNRSRSRSRSEAATLIESDSSVEEIATIVVPGLLQSPQIAPGKRDHRFPAALDEKETRQLMRCQSLRHWWHIRGRMHNSGGIDIQLLKAWMKVGYPAQPTVPGGRIPLASPEYNVVIDAVKEMALWDTWGREAWLIIVASEKDWIVDMGYDFEVSRAQFEWDRSLFDLPSSPFVNVFPYSA
mgnify:CR=1 FL=1